MPPAIARAVWTGLLGGLIGCARPPSPVEPPCLAAARSSIQPTPGSLSARRQACDSDPPAETAPPRVLAVHTGAPEDEAVIERTRGLDEASDLPGDIDLRHYYLGGEPGWTGGDLDADALALAIARAWRPDVLVTVGVPSFDRVGRRVLDALPAASLVFAGIFEEPAELPPGARVAGVVARPRWQAALAALDDLVAEIDAVALLLDGSEASKWLAEQLKTAELPRLKEVRVVETLDGWKRAVFQLRRRVDAIGMGWFAGLTDQQGLPVPEAQVRAWTFSHVRRPTFGFTVDAVEAGALVGVVERQRSVGFEAGRLAREIAGGQAPDNLPLEEVSDTVRLLNLDSADQLGLELGPLTVDRFEVRFGRGERS